MISCLTNIVGLSPELVSCFTDEAPVGFDTSTTGYYINDIDYGIGLGKSCPIPGYSMLEKARAKALLEFKDDLSMAIRVEYNPTQSLFSGSIGKRQQEGYSSVTGNFGWRFKVERNYNRNYYKDNSLVVRSVGIYSETTGSHNYVVLNHLGDVVQTGTVATVAGRYSDSLVDWRLPLWLEDCEDIEYTFIIANSSLVFNSVFSCCGNTPAYSSTLTIEGIQATNLQGSGLVVATGALGLTMNARIECGSMDWICNLENLGEYTMKNVIGRCVQFRAASLLIGELLTSNLVNICTLYAQDKLEARRSYLNQRYAETIQWIVENLPKNFSHCWTCSDEQTMTRIHNIV